MIFSDIRLWVEHPHVIITDGEITRKMHIHGQLFHLQKSNSHSAFMRGFKQSYFLSLDRDRHSLVEIRPLPNLFYSEGMNSIYSHSGNINYLFASGTTLREDFSMSIYVTSSGDLRWFNNPNLLYVGDSRDENFAVLRDQESGDYWLFDGESLMRSDSPISLCS